MKFIIVLLFSAVLCRRRYSNRRRNNLNLRKDEIVFDVCFIFENELLRPNDYGGNIGNKFANEINKIFREGNIQIRLNMIKSYDASIFYNDDSRGYPLCLFFHSRQLLCLAEEFWDLSMLDFQGAIQITRNCETLAVNGSDETAIVNSERKFSICDSRMFSNIISLKISKISLLETDSDTLAKGVIHQIFHVLGFQHSEQMNITDSLGQTWDKNITQDVMF